MSREWQQTRFFEYVMPHAVYYQSIWAVRDLERMEVRLKEITKEQKELSAAGYASEAATPYDRFKKKNYIDRQAVEAMILKERVEGIHKAMREIPAQYRGTILSNIVAKEPVSIYEDKEWKQWKQKFLFTVAKNLSIM